MEKIIRTAILLLCFFFCLPGVYSSVKPVDGGKYVLAVRCVSTGVDDGKWYAITAKTKANEIQVSADSTALLASPDESLIWTFKATTDGRFFLETQAGGSLKYNSGTSIAVDMNRTDSNFEPYSWNVLKQSDGTFFIQMTSVNRSLAFSYSSSDLKKCFKAYETGLESQKDNYKLFLFPLTILDPSSKALTLGSGVPWTAQDVEALDWKGATSVDFRQITLPEGLKAPVNRNPNGLVYVNQDQQLPDGFTNVVRVNAGGVATSEQVTLTDGFDFYAKMPFTARSIEYKRHLYDGWSTLALPFDYALRGEQCEAFESATAQTIAFRTVENKLEANQPYIIYRESAGDVEFSAKDIQVPATSVAPSEFRSNYITFTLDKDPGLYMMNSAGTAFVHSDGTATVGAFRGYLDLRGLSEGAAVRRIVHNPETPVCIGEVSCLVSFSHGSLCVESDIARILGVYSFTGQLVCRLRVSAGVNTFDLPLEGIYIVNNQKIYF